jgi:hypothetical protein
MGRGVSRAAAAGRNRAVIVIAWILLFGSAVHGQPNKELYDLQDRCGRRAAEVFARDYQEFSESGTQFLYSYQNHYNPSLNKCFFQVLTRIYFKSDKKQYTRTLELLDLNDNNRYGIYIGSAAMEANDTSTSAKVTQCEVRDKTCSSEREWVDLASEYMGD